jgi:N-acyl-D-aspartate/D-glutamate deacylase
LLVATILHAGTAEPAAPAVDVLIRGGMVYAGSESPPFVGDVAVRDDRIVYAGPGIGIRARRLIDARGMIVSPGLIDAHAHPDAYLRSRDPKQRLNAPWLRQGVSTLVIGVDGFGTPDVKRDIDNLMASGIGTNVIPFVGFGAVRSRVLADAARPPNPAELDQMKALVFKGMCEGATGLSAGLFYAPQSFAETGELIALAREVAPFGGLYDTHQRDESSYTIGVLNSVREALRIGREAGVGVHFAHLKALGLDVQGQAPMIIALINEARGWGLEVTADQYPWLASGSTLEASLIPRWAFEGGRGALLTRLDTPAALERIRREMRENLRRRGGPRSLLLTDRNQPWSGKTLEEVAMDWHLEPLDAAIRIILRSGSGHKSSVASFNMIQSDVDAIMKQAWVVTGSDGSDGHPRQFATFPEKYAVYVKQRHVIGLNDFIRRSTGLTADIYKLDRRGYLRPGYFADVLVFDPQTYAPRASYLQPDLPSVGVRALFVNGELAVWDDETTGAAAGRGLLRTPPYGTAIECRGK